MKWNIQYIYFFLKKNLKPEIKLMGISFPFISLYINELCIITISVSNISWIRGIPNLGF